MTQGENTVGCIGMGIMGAAMARNLLKNGHRLFVWNRTPEKCDPLVAEGASLCESPADMARRGPAVICTNVTDTPDVREVLFGDHGVASAAKPGLIVIDHSTINPIATQDFAARLKAIDVTLLDAPVSGGDVGARNGTLSIMVGGDRDAFEKCAPVFHAVGRAITHVGPSGMGQACKACNQVSVVNNLIGACEAIVLARKMGLDVQTMIEVVKAGAGGSWQLENLGPKIIADDLEPAFMIDLVIKDLNIVLESAAERGIELNGTALAQRYFKQLQANGDGRLGTQAMIKAVEG